LTETTPTHDNAAQPDAAKPGAGQPGAAQPGPAQPGPAQPGPAQPGTESPPAKTSDLRGTILRLVGIAACIGIVAFFVDLDELWKHVSAMSLPVLGLALGINLVRMIFMGWRWKLMNTSGVDQPLSRYVLFTLASYPAMLALPGILGFDVARGVMIGQSTEEDRAENLISVLSDRVIGLFSVILLGTMATLVAPNFPNRWTYIGFLSVLLAAFIGGIAVSASTRVHDLVTGLLGRLGGLGAKLASIVTLWMGVVGFFKRHPKRVVMALGACLLIHLAWFVIAWLLADNLGLDLSFFVVTTVTALSWVVLAIPVSWMGLGLNELSFIFLLSFQGVANAPAAALGFHQNAINIAFAIICIPVLLLVRRK